MLLTELPAEILDAVADYVPATDLRELACTCSLLHQVALKQLWYQVNIDLNAVRSSLISKDRLCIHQKPFTTAPFAVQCFCRRSNVLIDRAVIGQVLEHHSAHPLPFGNVRRLCLYLHNSDDPLVNAFVWDHTLSLQQNDLETLMYYRQFFSEIVPSLNLGSILVIQANNFTPAAHMLKVVDYLATLSPAPIYMSSICNEIPFNVGQPQLNVSHLQSVQLTFAIDLKHRASGAESRLSQFLRGMALPSLEKIILLCRQQIAAATEDFEFFFAQCKHLKVLRLHGVYPLDRTLSWIPKSVTDFHLLGSKGVNQIEWAEADENSAVVVTTLPNVTKFLLGSYDGEAPPLRVPQLYLPNLGKLIVQGSSGLDLSFLDRFLEEHSHKVQHIHLYGIPYIKLAPKIGNILPLQALVVLDILESRDDEATEGFLQFVSELRDIDTALLTIKYPAVLNFDQPLVLRTLRKNRVKNIMIDPDEVEVLTIPNSKADSDMNCSICSQDSYVIVHSDRPKSLNH
uniref:ARAD1D25366p n=1 Tax=Blastobotrys adeninivorans TaxID=409370 RepID=A0A060TGR7_BLAAD